MSMVVSETSPILNPYNSGKLKFTIHNNNELIRDFISINNFYCLSIKT